MTYQVHQYDYDEVTGGIRNKKIVITIDENSGLPDGMAIDEEDHLWVALFGGGKVVRISPETAEIVFEVLLPVPNITSYAFGGANLDELYITTVTHTLRAKQIDKFPLSVSLFIVKVPFRGVLPTKMII